jgi:predicted transposase/invertase (TIGR01784 family)
MQFTPHINYMFKSFFSLKGNRLFQNSLGLKGNRLFQNSFMSSTFSPKEQLKKVASITPNNEKIWNGKFSTSESIEEMDCNYTDPCSVHAFNQLFAVEGNKHFLRSLVNSISLPNEQLTEVTFVDPSVHRFAPDEDTCLIDIVTKDRRGTSYNFQVQLFNGEYDEKLALGNWAEVYVNQLKRGQLFGKLRKTIGIHIINFDLMENQREDYHSVFNMTNVKHHDRFINDHMEFHVIELKKFKKSIKELENKMDKWIYFLKNVKEYKKSNLPDIFIKDLELKAACNALERMSLNMKCGNRQ